MAFPGSTQPTPSTAPTVLPGFKWSIEAANKAAADAAFIRVGGSSISKRYLSGACRKWQSNDQTESQSIFVTSFRGSNVRLTGTRDNVIQALVSAGTPPGTAQEIADSAITAQNFQGSHEAAFRAEMELRNNIKSMKTTIEGYTWEQILWLAANAKSAIPATKASKVEEVAGPAASRTRTRGRTLAEAWASVSPADQQSKVILVTDMDPQTTKGVSIRPRPKPGSQAHYKGFFDTGIPIVANNIEKYEAGVRAYVRDVMHLTETDPSVQNAIAQAVQAVRAQLAGAKAAPVPIAGTNFGAPAQTFVPQPVAQPSTFQVAAPSFGSIASPVLQSQFQSTFQPPAPVGTLGGPRF